MLSEDYLNRFGGIGRLYGRHVLEGFCAAHVMVVGLGGVGAWTAEGLARSGVGELTLIDLDEVCITNTNRQMPALHPNYGKLKVEVVAERVLQINPECRVNVKPAFYSERNASELLSMHPHIVIDAIDSIKAKVHLLAACRAQDLPVLSSGGAGGKQDATQIRVDDLSRAHGDKLISSVRSVLRKSYGFPSGNGKKVKKFGIKAVYSGERVTPPQPCSLSKESSKGDQGMPRNLNCATGYGAVSHVTATFGLILVQLALDELRRGTNALD